MCSSVVSYPCLPTKREDPVCEDFLPRQGFFPWPFARQASRFLDFLDLKIETEEGEMAPQLGTPAALAEDFSSIPSTRVLAHNH